MKKAFSLFGCVAMMLVCGLDSSAEVIANVAAEDAGRIANERQKADDAAAEAQVRWAKRNPTGYMRTTRSLNQLMNRESFTHPAWNDREVLPTTTQIGPNSYSQRPVRPLASYRYRANEQ